MDVMVYQAGMAFLGLLEWQDRRETRDHLDLKVRSQDLCSKFTVSTYTVLYTGKDHRNQLMQSKRFYLWEVAIHKHLLLSLRNQHIDHDQCEVEWLHEVSRSQWSTRQRWLSLGLLKFQCCKQWRGTLKSTIDVQKEVTCVTLVNTVLE